MKFRFISISILTSIQLTIGLSFSVKADENNVNYKLAPEADCHEQDISAPGITVSTKKCKPAVINNGKIIDSSEIECNGQLKTRYGFLGEKHIQWTECDTSIHYPVIFEQILQIRMSTNTNTGDISFQCSTPKFETDDGSKTRFYTLPLTYQRNTSGFKKFRKDMKKGRLSCLPHDQLIEAMFNQK